MDRPSCLPKPRLGPNLAYFVLLLQHLKLHPEIVKIIINIIALRSRDAITFRAKLAEQAERYEEMASEMTGNFLVVTCNNL